MDAILPDGTIVNPTQRERDVAERLARRSGTITPLQTNNGTHIITDYVGDSAVFLNQFRPPVSMRVRNLTPPQQRGNR